MKVRTPETDPPRTRAWKMIDPRIAQRRAEVDRSQSRSRRRIAAAGLGVAAFSVTVVALVFSPALDVDNVEVIGTDAMTSAEVQESGEVPLGMAMASVNESETADRLMRDPRIQRVSVRRQWPSTVEVRITDRRVALRLVSESGSKLVSADGVVMDADDPGAAFGIWDLHVDQLTDAGVGESESGRLAEAIAVAAALPRNVAIAVVSMRLDDLGDLTLDIGEDREIVFGPPSDAEQKFVSIVTMLGGRVKLEGLCRLDVSDPFSARVTRDPWCDHVPVPPSDIPVDVPSDMPTDEPSME